MNAKRPLTLAGATVWKKAIPMKQSYSNVEEDQAESTEAVAARAPLDLRSPEGRTDVANGRRFAQRHRNRVRWCDAMQSWLYYDGRRWDRDSQRIVDALAKDTSAEVWGQTSTVLPDVDQGTGRSLLKHAHHTASAGGLSAMLSLARSEPGIPITPEDLDVDPWAFNVLNGTLDLRTGAIWSHDSADLITKLSPVVYDPAALCPTWDHMLETTMAGRRDLIDFVQKAVGYSLTGSTREQVLFLLHGSGANGKSTFVNAVHNSIGDYAMATVDKLLMATKGDRHSTELVDLEGKRFASSAEFKDGGRLNEALVKQLTGSDRIRGRRLYEDNHEFVPTHKLWLSTNHLPQIKGTDHGIWRRLRIIPFTVAIPKGEQDEQLAEKLDAERAGILAWAVRGCLAWLQGGLEQPSAVADATSDYKRDQDVLGAFLDECCVRGKGRAKASAVRERYVAWCKANGEEALNATRMGNALTKLEINRRTSNGVWYMGLELILEQPEYLEGFSNN